MKFVAQCVGLLPRDASFYYYDSFFGTTPDSGESDDELMD